MPTNSNKVQEESGAKEKDEKSSISVCSALTTTSVIAMRVHHTVQYNIQSLMLPSRSLHCQTPACPEGRSNE